MLASMAIQPKMNAHPLQPLKFPSAKTLLLKPLKPPAFSIQPKTSCLRLHSLSGRRTTRIITKLKLSASTADPVVEEGDEGNAPTSKRKLGVVVKPMEKPRIVLKFIWMQNVIGVALNQVIPGHGTIPLTPYYFWPKQDDAWEQLKVLLESKPWISRKQMYILLNQATEIINLWQE